jgi:hypothetical protein
LDPAESRVWLLLYVLAYLNLKFILLIQKNSHDHSGQRL